ncbi:MAG: hypothetical protein ACQEQ7_05110 [Thermodesulfobacteriota bacterium]
MAQEKSRHYAGVFQRGISERACVLGAGCSASLVCLLNFWAGQWELTKTLVSLGFAVFATILPLLSPKWVARIPIFLHIFRHAIPAVIIGVIAGLLRRDWSVMAGGLCAAVIPVIVVILTMIAHSTETYTSEIPVWLYTINWALGAAYWFSGAAYSASTVMRCLNRRKTIP